MTKHNAEAPSATVVEGFILTRQWRESAAGFDLIFWLATADGARRYLVRDQEAVFFVATENLTTVKELLRNRQGWRSGTTELRNFNSQPVTAIYFRSQRALYEARELIQQQGIVCHEGDIKPHDRFLMERFITGSMQVIGSAQLEGEAGQQVSAAENPSKQYRRYEYRPKLRAVSIDIETDMRGEQLYSIALYSADHQFVLMIDENAGPASAEEAVARSLNGEAATLYFADEKTLLEEFLQQIGRIDPDVIMGWNIVNFDLRALQKMCDRAGLQFSLGRLGEQVIWRNSRDNPDRFYALVPGRAVLDGIELMRSATYQFESFSLENVAREILKRGKLVDDVDARSNQISWQFEHDKQALAKYNLEDCKLVWDIFDCEKLIDFAIEKSLLTGLEIDRYGGSVAAFDFLYLPRLHRRGFVAPGLGEAPESNISPGGYVLNSQPGIFENVLVLDFKSLYPSIIRTFNIDPLALVLGLGREDAEDVIEGFDGGRFDREEAILPQLIRTLWHARDQAKASNNAVLSQAIKIIMNSFYGILGTKGCRFLDSKLVSSITRRGHEIILQSRNFIEERGYRVIYGDTDSVFVLTGTADEAEAQEIGKQLAKDLNVWWAKTLASDHGVESKLELEFETLFIKFLMPTVRGSDTGSKKRYAGMIRIPESETLLPESEPLPPERQALPPKRQALPPERQALQPERQALVLVFKGLESVRSDWSPLAREVQKELYRRVFLGEPYEDYLKNMVAELRGGTFENELVLRKRLRRKLSDYVKNVPPHVQAARKAETIRAQRGLPANTANTGFIEYLMTVNGPEPKLYRQSKIDYEFYLEKQITPIVDSILIFRASSMGKLLNRQIGLF